MLHSKQGKIYDRTQNEDGTLSTRCLDCFRNVAEAVRSEEELHRAEERHICPEQMLKAQRMTETAPALPAPPLRKTA